MTAYDVVKVTNENDRGKFGRSKSCPIRSFVRLPVGTAGRCRLWCLHAPGALPP